MRQFLKVKIKSLAEEARIIRVEERRANGQKRYSTQSQLREHRVGIVRFEARHSLLAYQYIRGKAFYSCESKKADVSKIDWLRVISMIKKYGGRRMAEDFNPETWISGGLLKVA